jgi:hypothetical protein
MSATGRKPSDERVTLSLGDLISLEMRWALYHKADPEPCAPTRVEMRLLIEQAKAALDYAYEVDAGLYRRYDEGFDTGYAEGYADGVGTRTDTE